MRPNKVNWGDFSFSILSSIDPLRASIFPIEREILEWEFDFPCLNLQHRTWLLSSWSDWRFSFCWLNISLTQVKRQCLSFTIRSNWSLNFHGYDEVWRFIDDNSMGMSDIMMIDHMLSLFHEPDYSFGNCVRMCSNLMYGSGWYENPFQLL